MGTTNELRRGIAVEREHRNTVKFIGDYVKRFGRMPPSKKIYRHISSDHLRENPRYYEILKRSKL